MHSKCTVSTPNQHKLSENQQNLPELEKIRLSSAIVLTLLPFLSKSFYDSNFSTTQPAVCKVHTVQKILVCGSKS